MKKTHQRKRSLQEGARKRCVDCLTLLSKGLQRVCKQSTPRKNFKLLITQDVNTAEQIVSDLIAKKDKHLEELSRFHNQRVNNLSE